MMFEDDMEHNPNPKSNAIGKRTSISAFHKRQILHHFNDEVSICPMTELGI